jgi:hypothetical protein
VRFLAVATLSQLDEPHSMTGSCPTYDPGWKAVLRFHLTRISRQLEKRTSGQSGYALPSLLLLVVVLTLLAFAALTHNYLQKQLALRSVFRVKAEYAAQSALAKTIAALRSPQEYANRLRESRRDLDLQDGSQSTVEVQRWGCFSLMTATASYRTASAQRVALVAQRPGPSFENALVFANTSHQLVFTGTAAVQGRIITGPSGVSKGTLVGQTGVTPTLPSAVIRTERAPRLPSFSQSELADEIDTYERLVKGEFSKNPLSRGGVITYSAKISLIDGSQIPADVQYVVAEGDALLKGVFYRRGPPLYVLAKGTLSFQPQAQVDGPVAIIARKEIVLPDSVHVDHAILYSATRIELKASARISAQVFSPFILLRSGSLASYPSLLVSISRTVEPDASAGIVIEGGATVEGTILSLGQKVENENPLVVIQPGASITGAVYSENVMTLDGSVAGTVMTREFYFYVQPTKYLGWLRSARIDRSLRPQGFLLPIGFAESFRLDILEWL